MRVTHARPGENFPQESQEQGSGQVTETCRHTDRPQTPAGCPEMASARRPRSQNSTGGGRAGARAGGSWELESRILAYSSSHEYSKGHLSQGSLFYSMKKRSHNPSRFFQERKLGFHPCQMMTNICFFRTTFHSPVSRCITRRVWNSRVYWHADPGVRSHR